MPQELPAVDVPSAPNAGRSRASRSHGQPGAGPVVGRDTRRPARSRHRSRRLHCGDGAGMRAGGVLVLARRGTRRTRREQVIGGRPHVRVAQAGGRERCPLVAHGVGVARGGQNRHGAVDADSTPPASTPPVRRVTQRRPRTIAASPLAHCRSTVRAGSVCRQPGVQGRDPRDVAARAHAVAEHDLARFSRGRGQPSGHGAPAPGRRAQPPGPRRANGRPCRWGCAAPRRSPGTSVAKSSRARPAGVAAGAARPRRPARRWRRGRPCPPGHGPAGQVEPQPGPLRRGEVLNGRVRAAVGAAVSATTAATSWPSRGWATPTTTTSAPAGAAQRLFDVVDEDGGPAGEHHLGTPPGDGEDARR